MNSAMIANACKITRSDINFVEYFLLNSLPIAIDATPRNNIIVVNKVNNIINNINNNKKFEYNYIKYLFKQTVNNYYALIGAINMLTKNANYNKNSSWKITRIRSL